MWGERQHQITIFSACSRSFQGLCDSFAQTKHASLDGLNSRAMDLLTNEPLITSKPFLNRVHTMLIKSFTADISAHILLLNQSEPGVYWCCLYLTALGFNKMGRMGNLTPLIGPSNTLMVIKRRWEVETQFLWALPKSCKKFFFKKTAPIIKYVLINYMRLRKQGLPYPPTINLRIGTRLLHLFSVNPILTPHSWIFWKGSVTAALPYEGSDPLGEERGCNAL